MTLTSKRRKTGPSSTVVDAILDRACYCCEVCGSPCADERGYDWSIHHRRPRGMGGTNWPGVNLPSNLMVVCGSGTTLCHGVIENHRAGAVAAGWLVLSRTDPATVAVLITRDRWCYLTNDGEYVDAPPPGRCGMTATLTHPPKIRRDRFQPPDFIPEGYRTPCRDVDPEIFFPVWQEGPGRLPSPLVNEAKAICAGCEVMEACADWAVEIKAEHGYWGGLSPEQRKTRRRLGVVTG